MKPGNIVGAIANEAELDSEYIGRIEIYADHSTIDMPEGMPKELFKHLKKVRVAGQRLDISRLSKAGNIFDDGKPPAKKKASAGKDKKPRNVEKSISPKPRKPRVPKD